MSTRPSSRPTSSLSFSDRVRESAVRICESGPAALAGLYDLTLLRYSQSVTRHQHDAEDAVQAALLRVANRPRQLTRSEHPWPYLVRMVRNESLAILRRRGRTTSADLSDLVTRVSVDEAEWEETYRAVWRRQVVSLECPSAWTGYDEQDEIADSSYAGCHYEVEAPIDENNHGLLFLNSRVRYREIYDGSSNTSLFGELLPSEGDLGWTSGTRATLRNTGEVVTSFRRGSVTGDGDDREGDTGAEVGSLQVGGFESFHSGGGNFNFADGSVRFLAERIDPELYRQLGHRSDGELMATDDR